MIDARGAATAGMAAGHAPGVAGHAPGMAAGHAPGVEAGCAMTGRSAAACRGAMTAPPRIATMLCMVLLGRQGAGKGTQAARLVEAYGCVHVSTGEMLRSAVEARSELGVEAEALMLSGQLVGDEIIVGIVADRLRHEDVHTAGVLLDGFPRTIEQAEALKSILAGNGDDITVAINLDVSVDAAAARLFKRGRSDDTAESIVRRLAEYESQTLPLLDWFAARDLLVTVDGLGAVGKVFDRLVEAVDGAVEAIDKVEAADRAAAAHADRDHRS